MSITNQHLSKALFVWASDLHKRSWQPSLSHVRRWESVQSTSYDAALRLSLSECKEPATQILSSDEVYGFHWASFGIFVQRKVYWSTSLHGIEAKRRAGSYTSLTVPITTCLRWIQTCRNQILFAYIPTPVFLNSWDCQDWCIARVMLWSAYAWKLVCGHCPNTLRAFRTELPNLGKKSYS